MAEFSSNAKGNLGVTLGAIGTGLSLLNNGLDLFNNGAGTSVVQTEISDQKELIMALMEKDKQISTLESQKYSDKSDLEVYRYVEGQLKDIRQIINDKTAEQAVINANLNSSINVISSQVGDINVTLANLTKTVIPNANVCPGWGRVAIEPAGCGYCGDNYY